MKTREIVWSLIGAAIVATSCSTLEPIDAASTDWRDEFPESLALRDDDTLLTLAMVRPPTWDPVELSMADQGAVIIADLLYDGLTEVDSQGELQPGLASSWTVSDDGLVWTFDLDLARTSVAEVIAAVERLRLAGSDSPAALLLGDVDRIEPVDEDSVRFVLRTPQAGLDWILSGVPYSIVPADGSATGPFSVAIQRESGVRLWSASTADRAAGAGGSIELVWADDAVAVAESFDRGEADAAVLDVVIASRTPLLGSTGARSAVRFYGLSPAVPALADVRVRRAVLAAVDRSALADQVPSGVSSAEVFDIDGLVGPTTVGFVEGACGNTCQYDPARAAGLLAEVGPVLPITIGYLGESQHAVSSKLAEQLRGVGFEVELAPLTVDTFAAAVAAGDVAIYSWGWVAPAGSIDAVLPPLLSGTGAANPAGLFMADTEATLARASTENDDATRWTLLQSVHAQVLDDGWLIPIAAARSELVLAPAVSGVTVRGDGSIEVRTLS